jgi:hypothetical protein
MCSQEILVEEDPKWQLGHRLIDSMSSTNQRPCWDAGDILGWGKAPERAKILAPWTPSLWKASPCHDTLKEQEGHHHGPTRPAELPASQGSSPQACWTTTHWPTRLPPRRPTRPPPTGLPGCSPARPPPWQHTSHHLPQEGSNTTRQQLQTCLGDAGLDAKGVTPELLTLKFYYSWTGDSFFFCFLFLSLSVCLSYSLFDYPPSLPIDFFGSPFFFLFLSLLFSLSFLVL